MFATLWCGLAKEATSEDSPQNALVCESVLSSQVPAAVSNVSARCVGSIFTLLHLQNQAPVCVFTCPGGRAEELRERQTQKSQAPGAPWPRKTVTECLQTLSQNKRASVHSPGDAPVVAAAPLRTWRSTIAPGLCSRVAKAPFSMLPLAQRRKPKMSLCERTHSTRLNPAQKLQ